MNVGSTLGFVTDLQKDQYVPNEKNLLYAYHNELHTIHVDTRQTSLIVGNNSNRVSSREGTGPEAIFDYVSAFSQISRDTIIVADSFGKRLRAVSRTTNSTRTIVGKRKCNQNINIDGQFSTACFPSQLFDLAVYSAEIIFVSERKHIRKVDMSSKTIVTLVNINRNVPLSIDRRNNNLYYVDKGLWVYPLVLGRANRVTTGQESDKDGTFAEVAFSYTLKMSQLRNSSTLLLADIINGRLRVLDLRMKLVSSICISNTSHLPKDVSMAFGDIRSCYIPDVFSIYWWNATTTFLGANQNIFTLTSEYTVFNY